MTTNNNTKIAAIAVLVLIIIGAVAYFMYNKGSTNSYTSTVYTTVPGYTTTTNSSNNSVQSLGPGVQSSPMQDYNVTSNQNSSAINTT